MNITFECLAKWLAPVLCFTAEEAWLSLYPSEKGSIHLENFPTLPFTWNTPSLSEKYEKLRMIRKVITGALEVARSSKHIGSSLQADVKVYLHPSWMSFIEDVDLAEISITSSAEVIETYVFPENGFTLEDVPDISVHVTLASGEKCNRCWKILPEVGKTESHLDLCCRCAGVIQKII